MTTAIFKGPMDNPDDKPDGDFLFTWKADKWPYEKLKALVDKFDAGDTVIQTWRCQAHRRIFVGARGYLYKQGPSPNGVFGIAEVVGPAERRTNIQDGEAEYEVPLRFNLLLDPTKGRFILTKDQILLLEEQPNLDAQGSGIRMPAVAARALDVAAEQIRPPAGNGDVIGRAASFQGLPSKYERLVEVYERDQSLVNELKRLYDGRCQICDVQPFKGLFGNIVEGHHITWLSRGGVDARENIILLCPNHHAAIHAADPTFDWARLEFRFGGKSVPVRVDLHLGVKTGDAG